MAGALRRIAFAVLSAVAAVVALPSALASASLAAIVEVNGYPELRVDGRPFFVFGAAFFYERMPRESWRPNLLALRALGINTLDLYLIWNWHELTDGDFDFDGHSNPRRDLRGLLTLARELGFRLIVRPGPVIRNEWRNGGYPAWLLSRPEFGMPTHDLLEGRYPPTATLQNAHSDDAAAEWLRNATHLFYARRWLERAMQVVVESRAAVIAVALDDDQGAYIDNQTWPAPHLASYLTFLAGIVREYTEAPTFINTYEMKVTASSPVWAMGDWYQSDAYAIGEHDRAQLEFSTGLLQTQRRGPVMLSEFQAGWLEQPGDVLPRPADPSNTLLAVHTLLGLGLHGLVDFPAQDTLYPAGWEAPFANSFYAWDAALAADGSLQPRGVPTRRIGGLVKTFGPELAATHVAADAAIAYMTSAYDPTAVNAQVLDAIIARTMQAQKACHDASLACDLVDLRFVSQLRLRRYPVLFVPVPTAALPLSRAERSVRVALAAYRRTGGIVVAYDGDLTSRQIDVALRRSGHRRFVEAFPGATLLRRDDAGPGEYLVAANYDLRRALVIRDVSVAAPSSARIRLGELRIGTRDALVIPLDVPLRRFSAAFGAGDELRSTTCAFAAVQPSESGAVFLLDSDSPPCDANLFVAGRVVSEHVAAPRASLIVGARGTLSVESATGTAQAIPTPPSAATLPVRRDVHIPTPLPTVAPGALTAYRFDVYRDGFPALVLQNDLVRVILSPNAGGRAFVFQDLASGRNVFTTVGALRDDVEIEPPLSTTDRIAKYTHQFPAGTFNRAYTPAIRLTGQRASVRLSYDAADVVPQGARFDRLITLTPHTRFFTVDETATFIGDDPQAKMQRAVSTTSLAVGNPREMTTQITLTPQARSFSAGATLPVTSGHALGFYDSVTHELATIAWHSGDVEHADLEQRPDSVVARLILAPGRIVRTRYGYETASTAAAARDSLATADAEAQGH